MAMTVRKIMILLYGAGGEPGRGEIPMKWSSKPLLGEIPIRGNEENTDTKNITAESSAVQGDWGIPQQAILKVSAEAES